MKSIRKVLAYNVDCIIHYKDKKYRNVLITVLTSAKKLNYDCLFQTHNANGSKTWEIVNELLGKQYRSLE